MHPASWWSSFQSKNPLSKTARKILNVNTPTAVSAERNWKRHALLKTKPRNRLSEKHMQSCSRQFSAYLAEEAESRAHQPNF